MKQSLESELKIPWVIDTDVPGKTGEISTRPSSCLASDDARAETGSGAVQTNPWSANLCLSQIRSAWLGTANRAMKLVHVGPAQPDQVVAP